MSDVRLDGFRLGQQSADLRPEPLAPGESLAVMGDPANVGEVLAQLRNRICASNNTASTSAEPSGTASTGAASTTAASPASARDLGANRLYALGDRAKMGKVLRALGGGDTAVVTRVAKHFGLHADLRRARVGSLDAEAAARAQLTLEFAYAAAAGHAWAVAYEPFMGLRGATRAGLRTLALSARVEFGVGFVLGTNNRVDAALCAPSAIVVEADQVADSGPLGDQVANPRSNIAAAIAGVNVFSALARGGWISIGHSQVKAATELDGKLLVTIPTAAAILSLDEFDPVFSSDTVFEALVTGIRDSKDRVQVTLSPSDTEVGLVMTADLFDFRTAPAASSGLDWGVLHSGLGPSLSEQQRRVRVGTHLWVQVLTDHMQAYPVRLD